VRKLSEEAHQEDLQGSWIERWNASKPRDLPYD
jgi:hypothetical protein